MARLHLLVASIQLSQRREIFGQRILQILDVSEYLELSSVCRVVDLWLVRSHSLADRLLALDSRISHLESSLLLSESFSLFSLLLCRHVLLLFASRDLLLFLGLG